MNEDAVREWIRRADDDFEAGMVLLNSSPSLRWVICFHMQQCVEKYLKAYLIFHGREHPRSHNIAALVTLCSEINDSFSLLKARGLSELTKYATAIRYGEETYTPDGEETRRACELAEQVRSFVRERFLEEGMTEF